MTFRSIAQTIHTWVLALRSSIYPPRETEVVLSSIKHPAWSMTVLPTCIIACGYYTDKDLHAALIELKFHKSKQAAQLLAPYLADTLKHVASCTTHTPCIVPVPVSKRRMRTYGFDHLSLLLQQTQPFCKTIPVVYGLKKIRETADQITLSRAERLKNLFGAFGAAEDFRGRSVLLVDDVYTTGATTNACKDALLRAGAAQVLVCVCAHA